MRSNLRNLDKEKVQNMRIFKDIDKLFCYVRVYKVGSNHLKSIEEFDY